VGVESLDGKNLYLKNPTGSSPLFTRALSGGEEHQVLDFIYGRSFVVGKNGIYYLDRPTLDGSLPVRFFSFSTRITGQLAMLQGDVNGGLAVSKDGRQFLYVLNTPRTSDLEVVENFR
jgi:hypothetical protein